jgi:membrane protein DedA with SNARE-associated domain
MFMHLEQILISYAGHIHLAIFTPVVSFIEEVIPPIPSPSVMIAAGSIAQVQDYLIYGLVLLALLGSLGKTLGASVVYYVADKMEDILSGKIAKFIGVTHEQIEFFGSHLGRGMRDYIILIILRALPVMPSSLISVGSGLLKVNFKLFVITTLIGSAIRDFIYIYLGYAGT